MLASKLIKLLQDAIDEVGDHPVIIPSSWSWYEVGWVRAVDAEIYVKDYDKEKVVFKLD